MFKIDTHMTCKKDLEEHPVHQTMNLIMSSFLGVCHQLNYKNFCKQYTPYPKPSHVRSRMSVQNEELYNREPYQRFSIIFYNCKDVQITNLYHKSV